MNHADETNLKYLGNIEIWRERYGSRAAWISDGVVADLTSWSFNTLAWTTECVVGRRRQVTLIPSAPHSGCEAGVRLIAPAGEKIPDGPVRRSSGQSPPGR